MFEYNCSVQKTISQTPFNLHSFAPDNGPVANFDWNEQLDDCRDCTEADGFVSPPSILKSSTSSIKRKNRLRARRRGKYKINPASPREKFGRKRKQFTDG